ncbi:hypothetical protein QFZ20_003916 [Flavobacterium sp. W4I14]|nr:hypothetical protein [Flavobacterium sp. W4I14]
MNDNKGLSKLVNKMCLFVMDLIYREKIMIPVNGLNLVKS